MLKNSIFHLFLENEDFEFKALQRKEKSAGFLRFFLWIESEFWGIRLFGFSELVVPPEKARVVPIGFKHHRNKEACKE